MPLLTLSCLLAVAHGAPSLPPVFGDHMVLQREAPVPVWGRAEPGETVVVRFAGQERGAAADALGRWKVELSSMAAGGPFELVVEGRKAIRLKDVLVGEVWIGSGQSNMAWRLHDSRDAKKEAAAAKYPRIRLLQGLWTECDPAHADNFSGELYFFGRALHRELGVPVGLILRAVSGTAASEWLGPGSRPPGLWYSTLIEPLIPFRIRGVVWDQGEGGSGMRGVPLDAARRDVIESWRKAWRQGPFPFIFVQHPKGGGWNGRGPLAPLPAAPPPEYEHLMHSDARARLTLSLPNTAMAQAIDLESGLHPRDKQAYGRRLALSALALAYERRVVAGGPRFKSVSRERGALRVRFDSVGGGLEARGGPLQGFSVAATDGRFSWAAARIDGRSVLIEAAPSAVTARYGWGDRPRWANLFNKDGFAALPFEAELPGPRQPDAEHDGHPGPASGARE